MRLLWQSTEGSLLEFMSVIAFTGCLDVLIMALVEYGAFRALLYRDCCRDKTTSTGTVCIY